MAASADLILAGIAAVVLLTGCGSFPVAPPVPVAELAPQRCPKAPTPLEYRLPPAKALPDAAQFTVDRALGEWSGWGGQIVDYREVDWARTSAVRGLVRDGGSAEPERIVLPVLAVAGCWENDPSVFGRLRAYWRNVPRERPNDDLLDSAMAMTVGRPASWAEAWSAAFISYVLDASARRYPASGAFAPSENHRAYAASAVDAATGVDASHRYVGRSPSAFAPRPGDVVCSYRNQPVREAWRVDMAGWRLGSAHCDIVVAAEQGPEGGRIFAVGGNILQSVSLSVHAANTQGRLVDSRFRNWAIVLADRANPGGL